MHLNVLHARMQIYRIDGWRLAREACVMKLGDLLTAITGRHPKLQPRPPVQSTNYGAQNPFHAVSVLVTGSCCQEARKLAGERFLSRNAPPLPLPNCTMPEACACRFKKHIDRRHHDRRAFGSEQRWYAGQNRRTPGGRRASDQR